MLSACQDSTAEYDGSCYYFDTSKKEHASATSSCSNYGFHLVFIGSQEEQDFIQTYMADTNMEDCWIGLTLIPTGEPVWLDGSSLTYRNFDNNSINEGGECFRIVPSYGYTWHDRGCLYNFSFICEKEIGEYFIFS